MREYLYPLQSNLSKYSEADILYIVDWDDFKQGKPKKAGGCRAYPATPPSLENGNIPDSVRVSFAQPIDITYTGLKTNACECRIWGNAMPIYSQAGILQGMPFYS